MSTTNPASTGTRPEVGPGFVYLGSDYDLAASGLVTSDPCTTGKTALLERLAAEQSSPPASPTAALDAAAEVVVETGRQDGPLATTGHARGERPAPARAGQPTGPGHCVPRTDELSGTLARE